MHRQEQLLVPVQVDSPRESCHWEAQWMMPTEPLHSLVKPIVLCIIVRIGPRSVAPEIGVRAHVTEASGRQRGAPPGSVQLPRRRRGNRCRTAKNHRHILAGAIGHTGCRHAARCGRGLRQDVAGLGVSRRAGAAMAWSPTSIFQNLTVAWVRRRRGQAPGAGLGRSGQGTACDHWLEKAQGRRPSRSSSVGEARGGNHHPSLRRRRQRHRATGARLDGAEAPAQRREAHGVWGAGLAVRPKRAPRPSSYHVAVNRRRRGLRRNF